MDRNFADLPESVDVVIFGTDVTQSIFAAACARNGMTVLHLDRNEYYGDKSCVFTFSGVEEFITSVSAAHCNGVAPSSDDQLPIVDDSEETVYLPTVDAENFEFIRRDFPCCQELVPAAAASNIDVTENLSPQPAHNTELESPPLASTVDTGESTGSEGQSQNECTTESSGDPAPTSSSDSSEVIWTKESLIASSRRFNIDMSPNLVYSTGKTVELLISSDVARYVEFKNIGKLFVFTGETFENVPCSRADVFSDTRLSLVEKRLLMRLFASALDQENKTAEEKDPAPFVDYLREVCRLPHRLVYFVQHAITMASDNCTVSEGFARTRNFLKSCSIYGPTPFLWPMYGCAEFPQAFCRLAAVYGAVYILRSSPIAIVRDKATKRCTAVILEGGKRVACNFIASSPSYCPPGLLNKLLQNDSSSLCYDLAFRAVLLSNKSLFQLDPPQQHSPLIYARVPRANFTASIIELPDHAMVCPPGTFLHHVTAPVKCSEKEVTSIENHHSELESFNQFLGSLFCFENSEGSDKPKVYWRFQYAKPYLAINKTCKEIEISDLKMSDNMFILPDALSNDSLLDFDMSIAVARLVFKEIKPDAEEFIPKMPQPPVSEDVTVADADFQEAEMPVPAPQPQVEEPTAGINEANPPEEP